MKKYKRMLLGALLLLLLLFTACSSKAEKAMAKAELGQKYLTELNYTEAVASFTEAIGLDPDSITGYMGRAQAYVGLEQYEEAKADYTTAIEKTTYRPYYQMLAYMGRAEVLTAMGDGAAAKADYDLALEAVKRIDLSSADTAFRQAVQNMIESITQASAKLDQTENGMGENADSFQQIMDSIAVPDVYAACKRYVLVNDYDKDGREEAFGYFGFPNRDGDYSSETRWEQIYIYFISADGQVTKVYDPGTEPYEEAKLCGRPDGVTDDDPTDFSACYVSSDSQVLAKFRMTYMDPEDMAGYEAVLTVIDSQPEMLDAPFDLSQGAGKFFRGNEGDDMEYVYAIRNGAIQQVGEVSCAAMEGVFEDRNTPKAAWNKYENGIRQWLKQHEYGVPSDLTSRVITGDYDGDGRQEGYAILEAPGDETGTAWVRFYYISTEGYIIHQPLYIEPYGYLRDSDKADPLLSAGKQKFMMWELDAGGSGSETLLFGVKDGVPYQPEVSGVYEMFRQDGSGYAATRSEFNQGYHNYVDCSFTFDAASGEFKAK